MDPFQSPMHTFIMWSVLRKICQDLKLVDNLKDSCDIFCLLHKHGKICQTYPRRLILLKIEKYVTT